MPTKMTPERALIVLNQCNTDGRIKADREELKQAVKVACEAIKTHKIKLSPWLGHTMGGNVRGACQCKVKAQFCVSDPERNIAVLAVKPLIGATMNKFCILGAVLCAIATVVSALRDNSLSFLLFRLIRYGLIELRLELAHSRAQRVKVGFGRAGRSGRRG